MNKSRVESRPGIKRLNLIVAYPRITPALDGISDYTTNLVAELSARCDITWLTGSSDVESMHGARIRTGFPVNSRATARAFAESVAGAEPDWLLVQYNPFSWGRWGLCPFLPLALHQLKAIAPGIRIALMVHEAFVPLNSPKFAVMSLWQRPQLWRLGRTADLMFFSIEGRNERFSRWFRRIPTLHLPVGSNIPVAPASRAEVRSRLGIEPKEILLGIFGSAHPDSLGAGMHQALQTLRDRGVRAAVLAMGTGSGAIQERLAEFKVIPTGKLPAEQISRMFSALDISICTFSDGVSTRRTSFMTPLSHGIPTVTTLGTNTDSMLRQVSGQAFLAGEADDSGAFADCVLKLATHTDLRRQIGRAGQVFFEANFSWAKIAERCLGSMN